MEVTINDKPYNLGYGLKSLFTYEEITGQPFGGNTLKESYMLLHSCLLAYNNDYSLSFDELIAYCDTDNSVFATFLQLMEEVAKRDQGNKKKAVNQNP